MTTIDITAGDLLNLLAEFFEDHNWQRGSGDTNIKQGPDGERCYCILDGLVGVFNEKAGDKLRWTEIDSTHAHPALKEATAVLANCMPLEFEGWDYESGGRKRKHVSIPTMVRPYEQVYRWNDAQIDKRKIVRLVRSAAKRWQRQAAA